MSEKPNLPFFCQFFQKHNIFYLIALEGAAIALCWWWAVPKIAPLY